MENCGDCGVEVGDLHLNSCDVARCMRDGEQALQCDHVWSPDVWTGFWPGELEAAGMGMYCFWGPDYGQYGWVPCESSHPGARPDLNAYYSETVWDSRKKKKEY